MKENKKTRLLSLVMVFAMLLSYIPVTVWATDPTTDIKAIEKPTGISIVEDYDDYVGADWLKTLELPMFVTITLANDTTQEVPVTWDTSTLDTRTSGYYSLPGTVSLPAGVTNGQNLTVAITVQVREYKNLLSNPGFEEGVKNWKTRGLGNYVATDYPRTGSNALMFGTNAGGLDFWNTDNADLASRVALQGAGQYYFAINVRQTPDAAANVTNFYACIHYVNPSNGSISAPALAANGTSNKITVSKDGYTKAEGICTLPGDVTYARLRCYASKNVSTTWETTGLRFDDAELVPLKLALKVEPSAIAGIKTEILSRKVIRNYPDYVGEDWKEALGLPNKLEVVTDTGSVIEVGVTWSYAGLDFTKNGKYTLVGTLDDESFPNPKGITASINIYVGTAENLLPNPSFESDTKGWYFKGVNPAPGRVNDPVLDGSYAAHTGTWSSTAKNYSVADTRNNVNEIGAKVAATGGGQYYFSLWMRSSYETPHTDVQMQSAVFYKTKDQNGTLSASTSKLGNKVPLSNEEYHQSCGVLQLPENTAWVRLDMNVSMQDPADLGSSVLYLDNAQLLAVNIAIPKDQEPADVTEILTEIPVRAVVKDYDHFVGANWKTSLGLPAGHPAETSLP